MGENQFTTFEYYLDQGVKVLFVYLPLRVAIPAVCWLVGALMWHTWLQGVVQTIVPEAGETLTKVLHATFAVWLVIGLVRHKRNWHRLVAWFGLSSRMKRKSSLSSDQTAMLRISRWFWYAVSSVSGAYFLARGHTDFWWMFLEGTVGLFFFFILLDRWRFIRKTRMPLVIGLILASVVFRILWIWITATYAF